MGEDALRSLVQIISPKQLCWFVAHADLLICTDSYRNMYFEMDKFYSQEGE